MSKNNVSTEYKEINGQTLKIELYYNLGGYNYGTGRMMERGYYASVQPVTLTKHDGYTTETYTAFTGIYKLIHPVKRKSKVAEARAEALFTEEIQQELIDYVMKKAA
jgi:hypothetical protein